MEAASVGCWSVINRNSGVAELQRLARFASEIQGKTIREFATTLEKVVAKKKKVTIEDRRALFNVSTEKQAIRLENIYQTLITNGKTNGIFSPVSGLWF